MSGDRADRGPAHYHVHVLRGAGETFFRGLTVVEREGETEAGRFDVWDDAGELGPPDRRLAEALPLDEALRVALELTARHLKEPIRPLLGAAPFELLGYRPARHGPGWLGWLRREAPLGGFDEVGVDGRPRRPGAEAGPKDDG